MAQQWLILGLFLLSGALWAQDERYYRQILSGELANSSQEHKESTGVQLSLKGASYKVDLNNDGIEEIIQPQKRNGVDWIEIRSAQETKIFEGKLLASGAESSIYKIKMVSLSKKVKALIFYLYEGKTQAKKFEATARLFFVTYENNDLSHMKMTEGPHYFHEKEAQRDQYFRRDYMVNVHDINNDGTREIAVQFNHIQRIFQYIGKGEWREI